MNQPCENKECMPNEYNAISKINPPERYGKAKCSAYAFKDLTLCPVYKRLYPEPGGLTEMLDDAIFADGITSPEFEPYKIKTLLKALIDKVEKLEQELLEKFKEPKKGATVSGNGDYTEE